MRYFTPNRADIVIFFQIPIDRSLFTSYNAFIVKDSLVRFYMIVRMNRCRLQEFYNNVNFLYQMKGEYL
jgi:hypothetical protein